MNASVCVEVHDDSRRPRQVQAAVELAMQGQWSEAVDLNRRIVRHAPDDVRAYNRLGRALQGLGRIAEACEAYSAALSIDSRNRIASHSLSRLARSQAARSVAAPEAGSLRTAGRQIDYGRLETQVEEPPELQDEYVEPYDEYEIQEPERAIAERIELACEIVDEARFEEQEGAVSADLLEEEWQQEERDRALAAEEERDER